MNKVEFPRNLKVEHQIQITEDYTMFQRLKGNRDILPTHVRELIAAFSEKPQLRQAKPVLLNENHEMIDGQHSFTAARNMGLPIFFQIIPGLTIQDARLINAYQRTWSLLDFTRSYAETGVKEYQMMLELLQDYPISVYMMSAFVKGSRTGGKDAVNFKLGKLITRPKEEAIADLEKLEDFSVYNKHWNKESFALAVWQMMNTDGYDHTRMMKLMGEHGQLEKRGQSNSYLRDLEDIYNKGKTTRLKFA